MTARQGEAIHQDPVWRDRSDFIIGADISIGGEPRSEQLWVRRVGGDLFEICCIPFFVRDLALGDIVETDAHLTLQRVVKPSGRYTFRVWFADSFHPRVEIAEGLHHLGALLEWSSENLLAVDAANETEAVAVADYLRVKEEAGELVFETGRTK